MEKDVDPKTDEAEPDEMDTGEYASPLELPRRGFARVEADIAALSHRGKVRPNNEDHYLVARAGRSFETLMTNLPEGELPKKVTEAGHGMLVADGMGGMAGGEVASRLAISTFVDIILDVPDWIRRIDDAWSAEAMRRVASYYREVDRVVSDHARSNPSLKGMGTTMTLAYNIGEDLFVAHVGDSRAYHFRGGGLRQLTRDQTRAQELADAGLIAPHEVASNRWKHVLTQAVGGHEGEIDVEVHHLRIADGDTLLLCSDGLTDVVDDAAIAGLLSRGDSADATCRRLLDTALAGGGPDNVTVIVARYRLTAPGSSQ